MTAREIKRFLIDNGFREGRRARHGTFWSDGFSTVMVGQLEGRGDCAHKAKAIMSDIQAAIRRRPKMIEDRTPPASPKTQIQEAFRRYESAQEGPPVAEEEEMPAPQQPPVIRRSPEPEPTEEAPKVPELFLHILTDPYLSDSKKVRMLTAYLEE